MAKRLTDQDRSGMADLYRDGETLSDIAAAYGCTPATVRRALRDLNEIPLPPIARAILDLQSQGVYMKDVPRILGITASEARKALRGFYPEKKRARQLGREMRRHGPPPE